MENKNKQKGILTLEIVFCIGLTAMFLSGALALFFSNQYLIIDTENNHKGLRMSKTGFEEARVQGFGFAGAVPVNQEGFIQEGGYVWLSDYVKQIYSRTRYFTMNRALAVELDGLAVDKENALGRDTCALSFSGDWAHPQVRSSISGGGGSVGRDVDVLGSTAYVAADGDGAAADFFAVNVNSPDAPVILSSLNTGPGLRQIHVAGEYVYAANTGVEQLEIVKIADPSAPVVSKKIKMASYVSAVDAGARSIFYFNKKIFLGLEKNSGPEFFVFDVSSPESPLYLGSFETDSVVTSIYVYGSQAYLATGGEKRLRILDISDPGHILENQSFIPNLGSGVQSGESLAVLGDRIFLGRAAGLPSAGIKELYALTSADLSLPTFEVDLNSSVDGMFYRDGLLFLAVKPSGANKAFEVFSFENQVLTRIGQVDLIADAVGLDCEGQNMFISLDSNAILEIVSAQ